MLHTMHRSRMSLVLYGAPKCSASFGIIWCPEMFCFVWYYMVPRNVLLRLVLYGAPKCSASVQNGICLAPINVPLECRRVLYSATECPTRVQKGIV